MELAYREDFYLSLWFLRVKLITDNMQNILTLIVEHSDLIKYSQNKID